MVCWPWVPTRLERCVCFILPAVSLASLSYVLVAPYLPLPPCCRIGVAPSFPSVLVLQERLEREMKSAADRKAAAAQLGAAVEGAKAAVWGTVEGVSVVVGWVGGWVPNKRTPCVYLPRS